MPDIRYEKTPPAPVKFHPMINCVPNISDNRYDALRDDIYKNGVKEPILFNGDYILSGRSRYSIARELGIAYPRVDFSGGDAADLIISQNAKDRALSEKQVKAIWAAIQKLPPEHQTITPVVRKEEEMAKAPAKPKKEEVNRGLGDNSKMTDEQEQNLFFHHLAKIKKQKDIVAKATADLRNLYKTAKADSVLKKDIDFAISLENKDESDFVEERKRQQQIAKWMNHPIGTQFGLFEDDRGAEERSFDDGRAAGLASKNRSENPHKEDSDAGQKWIEGWNSGQATLAKKFKKPAALVKGDKNSGGGDVTTDADHDPFEKEDA